MSEFDNTKSNQDVADAAVRWLVRVQSDGATAADFSALTDWLEASPAHLAAFDATERLWAEIDEHAGDLATALPREGAEILPFKPRPRTAPAPTQRRKAFPAALAAGFAAAAVIAGMVGWRVAQGPLQVYRTGVGETRSVTLADGTHVRMDAASTLTARVGWFGRQVTLGEGEATFDVAHEATRPFVIRVGDQRVEDVGTEFNIRHYDRVVDVTVRRGTVLVYEDDVGGAPIARLTRGVSLRHVEGSARSSRTEVDPDTAFAWTEGRLVCDHEALSEIVPYLNRRYHTPIRLAPEAASRQFTGVLELDDEGALARHIAAYTSLTVHRSDRSIDLT